MSTGQGPIDNPDQSPPGGNANSAAPNFLRELHNAAGHPANSEVKTADHAEDMRDYHEKVLQYQEQKQQWDKKERNYEQQEGDYKKKLGEYSGQVQDHAVDLAKYTVATVSNIDSGKTETGETTPEGRADAALRELDIENQRFKVHYGKDSPELMQTFTNNLKFSSGVNDDLAGAKERDKDLTKYENADPKGAVEQAAKYVNSVTDPQDALRAYYQETGGYNRRHDGDAGVQQTFAENLKKALGPEVMQKIEAAQNAEQY